MYDETNSVIEAFDSRNTALQRTALALGWKDWTVGATNEENDLIRSTAKKEKKEAKEGKKETRTDVRKARVRKAKIRR
jgi:predicted DNA binding protein